MSTLLNPAPQVQRWNTLRILRVSRIDLIAADALMLIAAIAAAHVHRGVVKSIGVDAAPSIIAAQHVKAAMADMDANAANELLGAPGTMAERFKVYESRRVEAAKALIAAAENITYGDSERIPIQTMQVGLGTYERLIQRARDLHERGSEQFIDAYREGAALMDTVLLPAADALDKANYDVMERTYRTESSRSVWASALLVVSGLLMIVALAAVQSFLTRRTRRTLNLYLVAATLLTLGALGYSLGAMSAGHRQLLVAKQDAFTSIRALWAGRAIAYSANSDESRYLLDQANAGEYQRQFLNKSARLAQFPRGVAPGDVFLSEQSGEHPPGFTGYLADEMNNITFPGERDTAVIMLRAFQAYLDADRLMRQHEYSGNREEAIKVRMGNRFGQLNWAFPNFDRALSATLEIKQTAFDAAVRDGLAAFDGFDAKFSVVAAAIAILIFLGLTVRIREYL